MANKQNVYIIGVGMTKFIKPRGLVDYPEMGFEAGVKAMVDAGINYDQVEQGVACYAYGDSTCGQRVFYQFGMTQIPILNVNNNCSTGSTGLFMARQWLQHGVVNCAMVIGFEKMAPGSLSSKFDDRTNPLDKTMIKMAETRGIAAKVPGAPQLFGNAGKEYIEKFGAKAEDFGEIARINHAHSVKNPYSQFQDVYTLDQIMKSPKIHDPLTKLQCCPTSDGAAAAVLVNEEFLRSHPELAARAVLIAGQSLTTDSPDLFSNSSISLIGSEMTVKGAQIAYKEAGITDPKQAKIIEVHDCFSANEMVVIDALGLCEHGKAHEMVRRGDITYGGQCVVNPSGGLISKGHPLGATGIAQAAELVWHLRGWATNRLYNGDGKGVSFAISQNLGLGGACVVSVLKRKDGKDGLKHDGSGSSGWINHIGYNPAVEARPITEADAKKVVSRTKDSPWMHVDPPKGVRASL
ncbi:hypothetical protein H072_3727 [Dactylellina haptotyla CBS 200.50]|uniref:propanoyl-CoA C-acyltransferase n=1 Tax=Dactylellina haptotyla (strain CBS 200.50) TaxID=1284197 RepID=S8BS48_DACHA|nr:hypothetical protein H072_3727 [Dactylellina haptotyla CBS 200.50]